MSGIMLLTEFSLNLVGCSSALIRLSSRLSMPLIIVAFQLRITLLDEIFAYYFLSCFLFESIITFIAFVVNLCALASVLFVAIRI